MCDLYLNPHTYTYGRHLHVIICHLENDRSSSRNVASSLPNDFEVTTLRYIRRTNETTSPLCLLLINYCFQQTKLKKIATFIYLIFTNMWFKLANFPKVSIRDLAHTLALASGRALSGIWE